MESNKLQFSWQILAARRKLIFRFGFCVGASLIFLTVILLKNNSLNGGPIGKPFFQGFNGVGPSELQKPADLMQSIEEGNELSEISKMKYFLEVNKETQTKNLTEKLKNKNLSVEEGNFLGSKEEGTHFRNFLGKINNGSDFGEEGKGIGNFSLSANNYVNTEKNTEGKSMENNVAGKFSNTENDEKIFSEENKIKISDLDSEHAIRRKGSYEKCDIFDGRWVRDDSKPYYPEGSCPHIDKDFDCHLNGRSDNLFLKWKWQPNGCEIPSMNATDFLERLRGLKLVFVGDSLNRNMWESLVCILRHSVANKTKVYEISGRTEFKKKGFYAFRFEDYNCSVDFVSSPFLVRESTSKGINGSFETLRLDLMDRTTSMYHDADIIIFNTGHWWTHEKTSRGEDYYQEGNYVHPKLKVLEAYKKALTTWARWIDKNVGSNRTQVFFRGYSVTHFRGGQWNSGGQCHKETEPIFNETYLAKYPSKMRALEAVLQEIKTPVIYLNISRLTDFRKDGHPSIYRMAYKTAEERIAAEQSQDCSHWCLPGVPDTWNELLYASLLKAGRGSWRN